MYPQIKLFCTIFFNLGFSRHPAEPITHYSSDCLKHMKQKNTWMHVKSSSRGGTLQHVKSLQWHMLNMLCWTKLHHVEIWSRHHVPVDMMCHSPSDLSTFIVDAPTRIVRYRHSPPDHSKGWPVSESHQVFHVEYLKAYKFGGAKDGNV